MKWILAGLAFALAVGLAVGTTAIRAESARQRLRLELDYQAIQDRVLELRRLSIAQLKDATPERLAASLRRSIANSRAERAGENSL
jgi:uncharacterized membrane-anchored protein YhcB (DUF1043 family)